MASNGGLKALIVIDQVGVDQLKPHLASLPRDASVTPLRLGYIPRTTPVGHATISTGKLPAKHRVQGREWFQRVKGMLVSRDIDDLPKGSFDVAHQADIFRACLACTIREREPAARIVTVAAKAFIPFLIGGRDSDVLVYPTDTKPQQDDEGWWRIIVRIHPRTRAGIRSVQRRHPWIRRQMEALVKLLDPAGTVEASWDPDEPSIFELDWVLSKELATHPSRFKALVLDQGSAFDEVYARVGRELLDDLDGDGPKFFLQSWFSTDMVGHIVGNRDARYAAALRRALAHIEALHQDGYLVVATSDHGGRCTSEVLRFKNGTATDPSGLPITLQDGERVVRSGDHLVGYDSSAPQKQVVECWDGSGRKDVKLQPGIWEASFASDQEPSWLLLPRLHERYADKNEKGGGDHGACVGNDALSDIDEVVPLLTLGATTIPAPPLGLDGVASYFMNLV